MLSVSLLQYRTKVQVLPRTFTNSRLANVTSRSLFPSSLRSRADSTLPREAGNGESPPASPSSSKEPNLWNPRLAQEISGDGLAVPTWIPRLGAAECSMRKPWEGTGALLGLRLLKDLQLIIHGRLCFALSSVLAAGFPVRLNERHFEFIYSPRKNKGFSAFIPKDDEASTKILSIIQLPDIAWGCVSFGVTACLSCARRPASFRNTSAVHLNP
jgi:hypothetical protein